MSEDCLKMFTGVVLLIFVIIAGYYLHESIYVCNIRVCVILIRSTSLFCMVFITVLYDLACHKPPYKKPHHSGPY